MKDKTLYVIPGATTEEMKIFASELRQGTSPNIIMNTDCKVFKIIGGELFEVVTSLKKASGE